MSDQSVIDEGYIHTKRATMFWCCFFGSFVGSAAWDFAKALVAGLIQ